MNSKIVKVSFEEDEIEKIKHYVRCKGLTSIPTLARYAIKQYMKKYPLTEKERQK